MAQQITLQTILFPRKGIYQPEEMYYHTNGVRVLPNAEIKLDEDAYFCTDTYFNAFDTDFWRKNTALKTLGCALNVVGACRVRVYLSCDPMNAQEKLFFETTLTGTLDKPSVIFQGLSLAEIRGFLTLEIRALSEECTVFGGEFFTTDSPVCAAKIAMVVCTCKREQYAIGNVNQWSAELFNLPAWGKRFELFLVDNGGTLEPFDCPQVHLLQNKNSGGAGGFTRGMMEALKGDCTHILLMDDDLTLHTGVLQRAWAMCSFLNQKRCLSAAMLNYDEKMYVQHERGGFLVEDAPGRGMNCPIGVGVDTRAFASVFQEDFRCFTYGAWWWFCVPVSAWKEDHINYAFPFFVRGDDIEFNLRLAKLGYKALYPAGFAVWHAPFFEKYSPAMEYLIVRNQFILASIHKLSYGSISIFLKHLLSLIFSAHYETAQVTLAGIRDFLIGPSVIKKNGPLYPLTFSKVIKHEKTHTLNDKILTTQRPRWENERRRHMLVRLLTLNGLLLPYKFREIAVFLSETRGPKPSDTYRCKRITYVRLSANEYYTVISNRWTALILLLQTYWTLTVLSWRRKAAAKQWRAAAESLEDQAFWDTYLAD